VLVNKLSNASLLNEYQIKIKELKIRSTIKCIRYKLFFKPCVKLIAKIIKNNMNNLTNKVAYITGGSKGIGYGIAKTLIDSGMRVAITGRDINAVKQAAESLSVDASKILALQSDVSSFDSEAKVVAETISHFGQLDVIIANAGVGKFAPIDQLSLEDWKATIDTNLTGVFNTVKASIDALKESKGYIITIASLAGTNFFETAAAYNASKFGLVGFTQAIMLDLRKYNIKVSTIMPGSVASNFNNHTVNDADAWKIQPEDIGEIVKGLLTMNPRTLPSKIEVRPSVTNK
jgi:3-oxoacyl-[acyl-carrier protein] reductase